MSKFSLSFVDDWIQKTLCGFFQGYSNLLTFLVVSLLALTLLAMIFFGLNDHHTT